MVLNYFSHFLIFIFDVSGFVSISEFASLVDVYVEKRNNSCNSSKILEIETKILNLFDQFSNNYMDGAIQK